MSILPLDPFSFISEEIKKQITDEILSKLAKLTEKMPQASKVFNALKSDAGLQKAIDEGLQRATKRFTTEYFAVDEDLVFAISREPNFWQSPSVRIALLEIIKNPTVYLESEHTVISETFSDVLKDRVNRERVDKAVKFYIRCLAESLWHLEPFRPIYEMQMQRISVENATRMIQEMHGVQADFRQAFLMLANSIGEQQKLLTDASTKALPIKPTIYHNLPQRDYTAFIGREAELNRVIKILRPYPHSQHALVTIDGIGGIGKSTLALEIAHKFLNDFDILAEEERFKAIIWTSAKEQILTGDGIKRRYQTHRTLDDIYAAIAISLRREDITKSQPEQQAELIRNALMQQRTLLIIDNLETIDDETVIDFIRELPAPTKSIVTTRHRMDVAYAVRLAGMPWQDAQNLIHQECSSKNVEMADHETSRLYDRTGGVPLAIVWSVAQIGFGYSAETILARLSEPNNDIIRFCFDGAVAKINGQPAEKLLIALSYFDTDASRKALGHVANLPELDRDDGLVALEKLSLINKHADRFSLLPVTKVLATSLATKDQETFLAFGRRWLQYLRSLYSAHESADYRLRFGSYSSNEDGPNLLKAVDWSYKYGTASDVFMMTIVASQYLDSAGRWNLMMELLSKAIDLARSVHSFKAIGRLAHSIGWIHEQRGDWEDAKQYFEESINQYCSVDDEESEVVALQRYSGVLRKQKKFTEARKHLDRARKIAERLELGDLEALVDTEEGKHARDLQQWDKSWQYFFKVKNYFERRTLETPRDEELAVGTWGHLAIVAYHQGRHQEAKELCLRSLKFFYDYGTKGYMATLTYRLALAEEALGEIDAARQHVNEALYWFNQLGMKPDIPDALNLKTRLESVS